MFLVCNLLRHACICNIIKNEFPWVHSNLEIEHNSSPLGRPLSKDRPLVVRDDSNTQLAPRGMSHPLHVNKYLTSVLN